MDPTLQLLFQCPQPGCNRKYKGKPRLAKHLTDAHGKPAELAETLAEHAKQCLSKPPRNGAKASKPIPIVVAPAQEDGGPDCECCICYDAPSGGAAAVPCGHSAFCHACLSALLDKHAPCPQCRGAMSSVLKLY